MTTRKHCAYTACSLPLRGDKAQFEVRVAPEVAVREGHVSGTFCDQLCWEAAKAVHQLQKRLIGDAEHVLSDEHAITG